MYIINYLSKIDKLNQFLHRLNLFQILLAIHKTAAGRRAKWKEESNVSVEWSEKDGIFSQEMITIMDFIDLIIVDSVKKLDISGNDTGS